MIIRALVNRYEDAKSVPPGWQEREASYALNIDESGQLLDIISLETIEGKRRVKRKFILPTVGSGRSGSQAYKTAYFLCDDGGYILGLNPKKFESSRKIHLSLLKGINTPAANAIRSYFSKPVQTPQDAEKSDETAKYIFQVNGRFVDYKDTDEEIRKAWEDLQNARTNQDQQIRCLVTGEHDTVIKLHDKVALRGVTMGAQPLISMNDQMSFRSYGKRKDDPPAEIGQAAAFAYASALNALLKDEKHRQFIGNDTMVFWAENGGTAEEELFINVFAPPKSEANAEVTALCKRIAKGERVSEYRIDCKFYLLCLSPNSGRMSVRFFHQCAFGNLIRNIQMHYDRLDITPDNRTPFTNLPAWLILSETTIKNSASDAAPLLGGQLLRCILTGANYPLTLMQAMLIRIRAGAEITQTKAAVIKAVLIKNLNEREVCTVALNEQSANKPYVLGRLFSCLERLQESANGTATIRERYFTSACANPGSVFPTLLKLSVHHTAKLDNAVFFEKLKGELLSRLDVETPFPAAFNLDNQGRFILGYYHQRQNFFAKKVKEEKQSDE